MTSITKSILHDATPSWNGYNYQGKIGLYVCLENILTEAKNSIDTPSFSLFLDEHHIEYEWIEDFSIKKNDKYLSLHQVKNKQENKFNDHIEAIATILYRKGGVLPDSDIFKYFKLKNNKKPVIEKKEIKNQLTTHRIIDDNGVISEDWKSKISNVDSLYSNKLSKCLSDFDKLYLNAFNSSVTYFHTAAEVTPPIKDIFDIDGIPKYLITKLENPRSLSCKNIHLSFDSQKKYQLSLSDKDLDCKITNQIGELLNLLHPGEIFQDDDIKLYKTSLCSLIDQNIIKRHQHIRNKKDHHIDYFNKTKPSIYFSEMVLELRKKLRIHNNHYWNLVCRENFELAYKEKVDEIENYLANSLINEDQYNQYKSNLEVLRIDIIAPYLPNNFVDFLTQIYPHHTNSNLLEHQYYNAISEPTKIKNIFFNFIQKVTKPSCHLIIGCNNNVYIYQPTCIDFNENDELQRNYLINTVRKGLAENIGNRFSIQNNVDYIIVNSTNPQDIISTNLKKITEVDSYDKASLTPKDSNKYTERKEMHFIDTRKALGDING